MKDILLRADLNRVPRIVAALIPDDPVRLLGQNVNNLALPLIAPLRADQNCTGHA